MEAQQHHRHLTEHINFVWDVCTLRAVRQGELLKMAKDKWMLKFIKERTGMHTPLRGSRRS